MKRLFCGLPMIVALACPVLSNDLATRQVVVEWRENWVEVFVSMPTTDLIANGTAIRAGLIGADAQIDFATLREDPSYILEELLGELRMATDGPGFEPMSMMAHGQFEALPFGTPFEAAMASAVCGVPVEVEHLPPEQTQIYLGAIRDIAPDKTSITLNLSAFGGPVRLTVFEAGGQMVRSLFVDAPKDTVKVERNGATESLGIITVSLGLAFAGAICLLVLAVLHFRATRQGA
ncbi:MAG: hypothetical protein GDA53_03765 [Rhodobacteraceae bacterium]|nr:hypothetical protein [Paracoccaceae bacterium]